MRHSGRMDGPGAGEEQVGLYDTDGRSCGQAPRWLVRRDNLRHAATAVILRNATGQVYVHRRTETKDVYPGMYDCCAGGVVQPGEEPAAAAERELAEELGVSGVPLVALGRATYEDDVTCYVAFIYEAEYDGPISWQPEEVAWGAWMGLEELARRIADPGWPFVPDSRALVADWLRRHLP